MKKTIAKTAALIMAVMLTGTACMPLTVSAYTASSTTSDKSQVEMKAALTIVKKRVKIPAETSEFNYTTNENYGTKSFDFTWTTPEDSKKDYRRIRVSITGGIITNYSDSKYSNSYSNDPMLAKLSNEKLIEKAKGYIKQLNPDIADKVKVEIGSVGLFSDNATVRFQRYENGILVSGNSGTVSLNKDTGTLKSFSVNWWENAEFANPKGAKSEKEIKEAYKKLCSLTPYYRITTDWKTQKSTAEIVYVPDMNSEIDAFTGKKSTIWDDMRAAEGTRYYGGWFDDEAVAEEDAEYSTTADADGGVEFTPEELKKIQQDKNLIKTDKMFEMLKKDKYVALNDDYKLEYYDIYSVKDKDEKETFYLNMRYNVKKELRQNYKGYTTVNVNVNAETGEVLHLNKYGNIADLPKLDVNAANKIADEVTKAYSKDIVSQYKASAENKRAVEEWTSGKSKYYETSRSFMYNRFVNGIEVTGEKIQVDVDSKGVVTYYSVNHTEDVTFVPNKILKKSDAFDKLYSQKDFDYYYNGWITKDGKVKTYLIYQMDSFYLNANTGKLCTWSGGKLNEYIAAEDVSYTDIKGIAQEAAIKALQKYGIVLTTDTKFKPDEVITEADFGRLLSSVLGGYAIAYDVEDEEVDVPQAEEKKAASKTEDEKHEITTLREAAVAFGQIYLPAEVAKLNIFKSPFSDVKNSDKEAGYIAVANAKGFITGTNGKLGGDKKITRAEAVQMMYDYLVFLSK